MISDLSRGFRQDNYNKYISRFIFHITIFNARKVKTIGKEISVRPPPLQSSVLQHVTLLWVVFDFSENENIKNIIAKVSILLPSYLS